MPEARRELESVLHRLEVRRFESGLARPQSVEAGQAPHNLPLETTSFVGREREITECLDLVAEEHLVTLIGIGGAAKTRLALKVAAESLIDTPGGVWFVDLAPLTDVTRVPAAVAEALGVREEPGAPLIRTLITTLRERAGLLVLDNCEHVAEGCTVLAEALLKNTPLRILSTSREALGMPGERIYAVPPLSLPPQSRSESGQDILRYEATELFVERARRADPRMSLDERTAPAIADICRQLDGIPLAIELAAGRVMMLSIEEIRVRLDDRFRLLTGRRHDLLRHQTLRAVVQWSYDQLDAEEQCLFRQLAVFRGGWTLAAATAVNGTIHDEFRVLDLLTRLVDTSLVEVPEHEVSESRYRFLETVRQFALEELEIRGELSAAWARHLEYFQALAESAELPLAGPGQV